MSGFLLSFMYLFMDESVALRLLKQTILYKLKERKTSGGWK